MTTYLDFYNEKISPSLKEIDLFLKTYTQETISIDIIEDLLDLSKDEIYALMERFNIKILNKLSFFIIMQNGSSLICKFFSREIQRKIPYFYSFYDISYIYQIPYEKIVKAAEISELKHITSKNLHILFSNIILSK